MKQEVMTYTEEFAQAVRMNLDNENKQLERLECLYIRLEGNTAAAPSPHDPFQFGCWNLRMNYRRKKPCARLRSRC